VLDVERVSFCRENENVAVVHKRKGGIKWGDLESNNESQVRTHLRLIRVACRACTREVFHIIFANTRQTLLSALKGCINGQKLGARVSGMYKR
jgi:hypothetical protein